MLPRLAQAVESLPPEVVKAGVRGVTLHPLAWSEPALVDESYPSGVPLAEALDQLRTFLHDDCAAELTVQWPLWSWTDSAWKSSPHPLLIAVLGADFEEGAYREQGHLRLDFGLDEAFLAELAPENEDRRHHLEFNILRLLGVARALQTRLKPERRRLWSESDGELTARLLERLQ